MFAKVGLALAVVLAAGMAGCMGLGGNCSGSQGSYGGSVGQQGVCNNPDAFAYGIQGSKSGSESYAWKNGGSLAEVQWGGQGSGSFTLTISDNAGTQVFQQSFAGGQQGAQQATSSGQPGTWAIALSFSGFNGQGGLTVTKS